MRVNKANGNKAVLVAIIMAISVLALAIVLPAFAANENVIVGITSDPAISDAAPGDTATVPIIVYNVTDLGAGTISVSYNSSVCNVIDVTVGNLHTVLKNISVASPPIADAIRENEGLRTIIREGLVKPLVYITSVFQDS